MRAWRVRTIVFCCALGLTVQSAARSAAGPSGRLAVTTVDRGAMWVAVVNADGSGLRRLTAAPGHSVTPVWSPDGRRLAYTHIEGNESQIYLINTDGTGRRRFTGSPGVALLPAWSPDGTRIAFVRRLGSASRIVVANVDRPGETPLTPEGDNTAPAWSPDGRLIAFVARGEEHPDLYVMSADGTDQRRLTRDGVLLRPGIVQPAWLPGSRAIAFVERIGRFEQQISTINTDGTGYRRFATGYAPAWSPDGRKVAFVVARHSDAQVYVANADGTAPLKLTPSSVNLLPTWSPDGTQLAFLARRNGDLALWVMRADGSDQRRLAVAAGDLSPVPVFSWPPKETIRPDAGPEGSPRRPTNEPPFFRRGRMADAAVTLGYLKKVAIFRAPAARGLDVIGR